MNLNLESTEYFDRLILDNLADYQPCQIPGVIKEANNNFEELKGFHALTGSPPVLLVDMRPTNTSILVALGNKLGSYYDAIAIRTKSQDIIVGGNVVIKVYLIATTAEKCLFYEPGDRVFVGGRDRIIKLKKEPSPQN